jgi:hypothetical protein
MADVGHFSQRPAAELRAQAAKCRRAGKIAGTIQVREALIEMADRYDELAEQREQEQRFVGAVRDE